MQWVVDGVGSACSREGDPSEISFLLPLLVNKGVGVEGNRDSVD